MMEAQAKVGSRCLVEVSCMAGDRVRLNDRRGVVKSLLREDQPGGKPKIVALVYWDGGAMSFEQEKLLMPMPYWAA